ncbi:hypothetical protein HN51_060873 [Arachis hypogaea]|uniref:Plant bHLH transcription factor ACT-like domain-containing protein n=1 Tax=Arachis hypogaea TaxID=3818 RepID=A0A444XB81_ARAHY|nr:uncharacterized protein LOC107634830 [Arachis ipaensis]XP_025641245.1 uncharacterized protein LOC112736118 [Arachis hypogaea]QHO04425.1 uncharacterized protein DS421_13g440260 [Arachis hypogaea]RYQ86950.1 hypothetical protein Ahy_B10g106558 [Arachis hypogaea]
MTCRVQRRISLRRKLHILRALANSNNSLKGKRRSIVYIYKLKVALESIKREYEDAVSLKKEVVKVEKVKGGRFVVRIKCEKGGEKLVSILEAFEEMSVNVENAKVSCEGGFSMDAIIAVPQENDQTLDVTHLTEALLKAIEKQSE